MYPCLHWRALMAIECRPAHFQSSQFHAFLLIICVFYNFICICICIRVCIEEPLSADPLTSRAPNSTPFCSLSPPAMRTTNRCGAVLIAPSRWLPAAPVSQSQFPYLTEAWAELSYRFKWNLKWGESWQKKSFFQDNNKNILLFPIAGLLSHIITLFFIL